MCAVGKVVIACMNACECMFITLCCMHVCCVNICAGLDIKRLELIFLV